MPKKRRLDIISSSGMTEPDAQLLEKLYSWVDEIPLSRPKTNLTRDFSDGVMMAEILHFKEPRLVDMHNYIPANAFGQKIANWQTLNRKVLYKLGLQLSPETIRSLSQCRPWVVVNVLIRLRDRIDDCLEGRHEFSIGAKGYDNDQPEVDQHGYPTELAGERRGRLSRPRDEPYSPSWSEPGSEPGMRHVSPRRAEFVPVTLLIEKQREDEMKAETVNMLHQKIKQLERLLSLKDVKIEDLNILISELKTGTRNKSNNSSPTGSPRSHRRFNVGGAPRPPIPSHLPEKLPPPFLQPKWQSWQS